MATSNSEQSALNAGVDPAVPAPSSRPAARGWLNRSVLGFGVASFLSDIGHETTTAALPTFLASLGAPPAVLGVIEGVADGLSSAAKLVGGWLADHPRWRKPIAVLGYFLTGVSNGAYAVCATWTHVLLTRSGGWISRGIRAPARNALLADSVPRRARGRAFGFQRALDSTGAVLGPLIAILLVRTMPLRHVLAWSLLPGLLAALVFAILVKPELRPGSVERRALHTSLAALPRRFRGFLVATFVFGIGDFARTLLILHATRLLEPKLGMPLAATTAIGLYALHNLVYAAAAYPIGRFADRTSPRRLLVHGYVLGAMTALLAAFALPSVPMLAVLFAIAGLCLAYVETLEATVVALEVPSALRGTAYGTLAAVSGIGDLLSSSLVGILWSACGPLIAFGAAGVACLSGAAILGFARRR